MTGHTNVVTRLQEYAKRTYAEPVGVGNEPQLAALCRRFLRPDIDQVFLALSFSAFVAAFGSIIVGWKLRRLETTPRLFTLTFLLVAFGASDPNSAPRGPNTSVGGHYE